jgi:catechol 2,3-dioxygenase-like lactoylglutathione lyase family enzyme
VEAVTAEIVPDRADNRGRPAGGAGAALPCSTSRCDPPPGGTMDYRLEVVGVPVSDVDRAVRFYVEQVGFHLDHDNSPGPGMRVVQLTPAGSPTSIVIGVGLPIGEPGTTKGLQLVVQDIDAARAELAGRGVQITDVQQLGPEGAPGSRFAFFADPDGNGWSLQEIKR